MSTDLLCDGVNHCGDNSDETTTSLCAGAATHLALHSFLPSFLFYRVLPSFTELPCVVSIRSYFYLVLPSFTWLDSSFINDHVVGREWFPFTEFYRV